MTRRFIPFALAAAAISASAQPTSPSADWMLAVLRTSMETKKGVTLHINGQTLAMLVIAVGEHFVEGRNQQSSKITVRIASIDAAVMA